MFQAEAQDVVHLLFLNWFGKIVVRAKPHRHRHLTRVPDAGKHHDFRRRSRLANPLKGLQSVRPRHHHVKQNHVRLVALYFFDRLFTVGCGGNFVGVQLQYGLQITPHTRFVVDDQDVSWVHCPSAAASFCGGGFSRQRNENLLPLPGSLSTHILPPAA